MNKSILRKKIVHFMLNNSSICRNKYYDMFYRNGKEHIKLFFNPSNDIEKVLEHSKIGDIYEGRFFHTIDESIFNFHSKDVIGNMPPNYALVINNSINDLISQNESNGVVEKSNIQVLKSVKKYIFNIITKLEQENASDRRIQYFQNMLDGKAETLEDALQRILLWSSIFWQTGHKLVGLGRLDLLLDKIDADRDENEIVDIILEFILELHKYYEYKSAQLLGDIGQIIILGGAEEDGYFSNKYTYCILEAIKKARVTDPKALLRVSEKMPDKLMSAAVECLIEGSGSPLFSNDDVIIPCLLDFGYEKEDAYNYVTSACWEPLSYGNSLEQNNLEDVKYADVFVKTMKDPKVANCGDFREFVLLYETHLKKETEHVLEEISAYEWDKDPLFTLFTAGCKEKELDISQGGAKYNNYGILSVGLANAVNSIFNIKKDVFEKKNTDLKTLHNIWKNTSQDKYDDIIQRTKDMEKSFGHDEEEYICLVNEIMDTTQKAIADYKNRFGGKVKIGLSSPGYILKSKKVDVTYDGREKNSPCSVHISSDDGVAYTELISFASKLKYTGVGSNGNVIDFFVAPNFIRNNKEKFEKFIRLSIKQGFFQMQMNIISSETLIAAREKPEMYKNLIVRVWGFSAYFVELPDDYKDLLIKRALKSEGKLVG